MDRETWQDTVHEVAKSWLQLSDRAAAVGRQVAIHYTLYVYGAK